MIDPTILNAIIGAIAMIIVAIITQSRVIRVSLSHQFARDEERREFEKTEDIKRDYRLHIQKAHSKVSLIQRRFSLTGLTIDWTRDIKRMEFDQEYLMLSAELDEARMVSSFIGYEVSKDFEELYDAMNCYWGYFRTMLYRIEQGDNINSDSPHYRNAFDASNKVSSLCIQAKNRLIEKHKELDHCDL